MNTKKIASVTALSLFAGSALAQPGDKNQIDVKARIKGTTAWLEVIDTTAATASTRVDVEVGVFFYRSRGVGFSTSVFAVMTSNWLPGDRVKLLDRADSALHPDGRQGRFNFGGQGQAAYTTGIDVGRLRVASLCNEADALGGGISVKQNTPVTSGTLFDTSDGVLGFKFETTIVNTTPGRVVGRTLVCDVPKNRINNFTVYDTTCDFCYLSLLPTDVATINVHWPKCSSACPADFDCNGFLTGDDFDGFVTAFEVENTDANLDGNSFVNGDDFDAYVLAFEAGC